MLLFTRHRERNLYRTVCFFGFPQFYLKMANFSGFKTLPLVLLVDNKTGGNPTRHTVSTFNYILKASFICLFSECPPTLSGQRRYFCPSPNAFGVESCVTSEQLCDGHKDCPNAEDENKEHCLFYRTVIISQADFNMVSY